MVLAGGLYAAYVAPMSVEGSTYVDTQKAYGLYQKGVKFLDVRPQSITKQGKIKGAKEFYVGYMTPSNITNAVSKSEEVVVYCNGQHCSLTPEALSLMVSWGYKKLYYYRDGYPAWEFNGLPIE